MAALALVVILTAFASALIVYQRRFLRVHRSIVVNTERIREVQPWFKGDYVLILHDGTKLRSGRTYRATVQGLIE